MSNITFTVTFTGTPDDFDKEGAKHIVEVENERRASLETPLDPLPYSTGAELKASYLYLLEEIVTKAHSSYAKQGAEKQQKADSLIEKYRNATPEQRASAISALES